ncbi:hypothetical protein XENOCAPTIV_023154 [Xenoophorus captivus]|uniref:RNA exonuclease 1 homolog-like domain-containing protein n=1 Tax=Xenoophorus captivus TaxID=1517983 RepID=A0ABV0S0Z5_9TELE
MCSLCCRNGIKTPNAFSFLWQTGDYTPANDNSLHELERLDKEIESVRHEVEQEQRRLSCYQTSQADRISNKLVTRHETSASYGLTSSKEHKSRVQSKYVVDDSKPRTDLEYDPLSNFSAALRSYSSSGNEHKGKTRQDGTSSRSVHFGEKPFTHQVQMYRTQSPENLDDCTEDGVLVIDVSLSPNGTSDQPQNSGDLASGKSSQDTEKDVKAIKTVKVFLDSPTQKIKTKVVNAASLSASSNNANNVPDYCSKESNPVLPTFDKTKGYRNEAYLNYIPFGTAVVEVGNNMHLILPQGSFPLSVTSTSSPVASVLTPTLPVKRKLKQQSEGPKDKVPHDVRQRYVNMFTEEFLKTTADVNKAFEKCYTVQGLELSRVTVINSNLQVIYDTFVRPDNEVIDYNTSLSLCCFSAAASLETEAAGLEEDEDEKQIYSDEKG